MVDRSSQNFDLAFPNKQLNLWLAKTFKLFVFAFFESKVDANEGGRMSQRFWRICASNTIEANFGSNDKLETQPISWQGQTNTNISAQYSYQCDQMAALFVQYLAV